jgi:TolB-like protein/Tfp pilus assembly protein PilF
MADLFIGYARSNRNTIEQLAPVIEAAGYSVWWDRNIIGGAEFSRDIERELNAAKVVIIAWSGDASDSPWVKDEAAFARDHGKLLPISLDSGIPPMGFRQYQAVDFSSWNGKPNHPAMEDLLRAVKALLEGSKPPLLEQPPAAPPRRRLGLLLGTGAVAMLALLVAIAAYQFRGGEGYQTAAPDPAETEQHATSIPNESEPRIEVSAIRVRSTEPALQDLAATLSEEISSGLSRFSYLLVSAPGSEPADVNNGYVLHSTLQEAGGTLRLSTQLIDRTNGQQVWGNSFEHAWDETDLLGIQDDLTDRVVASVADPYGALMRDLSRGVELKAIEDMSPYDVILRYFIFRQRVSKQDHLETRNALEHGVKIDPGNAHLWAALATVYVEEYKHDYNPRPDSLDRALATAHKAVSLRPDSASTQFALAEVHFFRQEVGPFRAAAERAIALNPRDSDAMAFIGIMTAYTGDWERGRELSTRAREINPNHPGWYLFGDIFQEYLLGNYEQALALAERVNLPGYFADPYCRAIIHARLGNEDEAAKALDEFRALWPNVTLQYMREEHLVKWFYADPELIEQIMVGMRMAGLE